MLPLLLFGILACAAAAPTLQSRETPPFHDDFIGERYLQDEFFDNRSFWDKLRRNFVEMETVLDDMMKRFPTIGEVVDGNVYRITIPLPGFEAKDITVKAKKNLVIIQAVHNYESSSSKSYLDMRSLPAFVNPDGKWTYEDDILKVEFPLEGKDDATTVPPSEHSREEMETDNTDTNQNADTGVDRGDVDTVLTNVVPKGSSGIETTTYAVDLKDEVEFVPVRQVK